LRGWTILEQAPPGILALTRAAAISALVLGHLLAHHMHGKVTVLGFAQRSFEDFRDTIMRRVQEAGLAEADLHVTSGKLVEQISAQRANRLLEILIVPPHLGERTSGWTSRSWSSWTALMFLY
jgi:hypothetical protein